MMAKRVRKGVLLFEVAFVVLLVSIISLFLFRGYSIFMKAGRKSSDYLRLISFTDEKIWDLEIKERNKELTEGMDTDGDFDSNFSWHLMLKNTDYNNLKEVILGIDSKERKGSFDTVIYLFTEE